MVGDSRCIMKISVVDGLPFVGAVVTFEGREAALTHILLDTGSAGSILAADLVAEIGVTYAPNDEVHRIRGVGGVEFVFAKAVDRLAVGDLQVSGFVIEVGAMDYGFAINGILGMDFLMAVGAMIDLGALELTQQAT